MTAPRSRASDASARISGETSAHDSPDRSRWTHLARLIRLRSQTGTLLLALPSLWSLALASHGRPDWELVCLFLAGAFLMRSAGVILNDLADRDVDRHVARTKSRPLAAGSLTVRDAWIAVLVLLSLAVLLLLRLPPITWLLSPFAVALAAGYPYAKRFVSLPQAVLGVAFGWAVVMAWAAARHRLELPAWLLFGSTVCWAVAYDTVYALQDRIDDQKIGVKSSALLFGEAAWLAILGFEGLMLGFLGLAGWAEQIGPAFYVILAGVAIGMVIQTWQVREPIPPALAFRFFRQHVWFGLAILGGILAGYW